MKKRGMALVLALLLLAGCAPEAEMPPPPSTSAETEPCGVYTDWSKLTPYVPEDRESLYYCSAVGPHGIVAMEDTGECVLISPEGEEVWRTPGKEAWFWDNFWSGDTAILWDGEDTRLMDTHTGQSYGLDGARDPQGFHEGLARAHDEADFDCVTWAPLSRKRRRERGYDQGELLARAMAKRLGLPAAATLVKARHTQPQSGLDSAEARRANALGAYAILNGAEVAGKRVLLADDVVTSGATLSECARTLLEAGAEFVWCVTLAQARPS